MRKLITLGTSAALLLYLSTKQPLLKEEPKIENIQTINVKFKFREPVAVLVYHRITNGKARKYKIPVKEFEQQMEYLKENKYKTALLSDFKSEQSLSQLPSKTLVLTFDDTGEDFYKYAFPILRKLGLKAMIFPIVCTIGKRGWLSWEQLRKMQQSGFIDVQSHTMTHRKLTKLSDNELWYELYESKKMLEENLGKEISYVACPYGLADERVKRAALKAGYKGLLVLEGVKNEELNLMEIKRIEINGRWKLYSNWPVKPFLPK